MTDKSQNFSTSLYISIDLQTMTKLTLFLNVILLLFPFVAIFLVEDWNLCLDGFMRALFRKIGPPFPLPPFVDVLVTFRSGCTAGIGTGDSLPLVGTAGVAFAVVV